MRRILLPILAAAGLLAGTSAGYAQNIPCSPFTNFPLNINLGVPPLGIGGETVRCQNQKVMDAVNTLSSLRGVPTGIATLDVNGKLTLNQLPPIDITLVDNVSLPSLTITGNSTSGVGLNVNAPGANSTINSQFLTVQSRSLFNSPLSGGASDWLGNNGGGSANQYAYGSFAQGVFLSGLGDVGVVGATRTTDISTPGRLSIGTMGWGFNFNVTAPVSAWGGYFEARRKTGAGPAQSVEINVTELGSTDVSTPTPKASGPNAVYSFTSHALALASGGNCTTQAGSCWDGQKLATAVDASVALPIYANGAKFKKGIIFSENALTGCDGSTPGLSCTMIEAGRGASMSWIDGSIRQAARISSDVSPSGPVQGITFTDSGPVLSSGSGSVVASGASFSVSNPGVGTCVHTAGGSAETVACSSDERLKRDITDAGSALPSLTDFRVRDYVLRADGSRHTGVIAQEVQQTHPEMVHQDDKGMLSVDEPNPWLLVKATQELRQRQTYLEWGFAVLALWLGGLTAFVTLRPRAA